MLLRSVNPYTGKVLEEFKEFGEQEVEDLINKSDTAFADWKKSEFAHRRTLLKATAGLLRRNRDEYARSITLEMGKPITESRSEVEKCAWVCDYYAENGKVFLEEEVISTDAVKSYARFEPLGTILGIMPWNFPFWQVFRFAVPSLMAGNTVLLKHSSNVQTCASHIENIFAEAGFSSGIFTNLVVSSGRVEKIIEHDAIKGVSLTGSEHAGSKVAETAGRNIKKSLLELGGSNAFIVLDDADIEKAAEVGVRARMMNAGQSCIAAKRFIIHEKVSRKFLEAFLHRVEMIRQGDPEMEDTTMGPLASVKQAEEVERQVTDSVRMGARIIKGGKRENAFFSPTVVEGVKPGMPLFDEEVFGPVAPVMTVNNENEAVRLANLSRFGLGVSLFTADLHKAAQIAGEFKDGAVFINELVKSDPRLPFGGTGKSGYGRELSVQGIREFVNIKTVYIKD